ncbi:hypothetical protein GCM10009840_08990 [Pseudolysinimonas kribbensis]|uniref:DUF2244 domain-containing protein n=2 Tax=Pseudolysinimonas kribbensis TaxID=433641 RepID=A0ABQ6K5Q2_9MICO|nr:hypothetical protein GCM10025881_21260 [Pseudolysinimonas kribbensis]
MTDDGPEYRYSFTVTEHYRRELTRALIGAGYRSAGIWMAIAIVLVAGIGSSLLLGSVIPVIVAAAVDVALVVAVPVAAHRRVEAAAALGSVARSGFGESSFRIGHDLPGMLVDYDRVVDVTPRGDLVWLRIRMASSTPRAAWPRALFPDAELARLRDATAHE